MRNSPPEVLPEGRCTRFESPTPPAPRRRLLAVLSGLVLVGGATCVGGWMGGLVGLWVGRALGVLRLGFSTGLAAGTLGGLVLGSLLTLTNRPADQ